VSTLKVIVVATRPGRIGPAIAGWFAGRAADRRSFDHVELVDLAELDLPIFNESAHPRLGDYQHTHTQAWSRTVDEADALVFVTPEYNHFPPPSLINAVDYLHAEWAGKPVGLVSYGGGSGGRFARAAFTPFAEFLSMRVPATSFGLEWAVKQVQDGQFVATPENDAAARLLVDELRHLVKQQDQHAA
jgi:NAD(P)H-dependent FMN reductase